MSESTMLRGPALPAVNDHSEASAQLLTLVLEGMTADDYLSWVYDPEPPALGNRLRSVTACPTPCGQRIDAALVWERDPSDPRAAAIAAGFTLTPEVVELGVRKATEIDANGKSHATTQRAHRMMDTSDASTPARIDRQQCMPNMSTETDK